MVNFTLVDETTDSKETWTALPLWVTWWMARNLDNFTPVGETTDSKESLTILPLLATWWMARNLDNFTFFLKKKLRCKFYVPKRGHVQEKEDMW